MRTTTTEIPAGIKGTARTIREMHRLVALGVRDPSAARLAMSINNGATARRDYRGEAQALLSYVQQNVRYTRDPWTPDGLERVAHPLVTLQSGGGDCDDLSVVLATLASSIGAAYAFRTVGTDASKPDDFQHVYVMIYVPNRGWAAADPSFEQPLGWEPAAGGTLQLPDGTAVAAAEVVRDWLP